MAIFPQVVKHIKAHLILVRNFNERRRPSQEALAIRTKLTDDLTRQKNEANTKVTMATYFRKITMAKSCNNLQSKIKRENELLNLIEN